MKKIKVLVVMMVALIALLISGCGNSDKFSGTWVGGNQYQVEVLTINKNGNNYLISGDRYYYEEKREWLNQTTNLAIKAIFEFNEKLVKTPFVKTDTSATAKEDRLIINGTMDTEFLTFKESDKTLLYKGMTYKKLDNEKELPDKLKEKIEVLKQTVKEKIETNSTKPTLRNDKGFDIKAINFDDSILK